MKKNRDDIEKIRDSISDLRDIPDVLIYKMYSDYSDLFAAGWMMVDDDNINGFRSWLLR